ncbi:MAG: hypothetical protein J0H02_18115 [Armatimonadetes bacterium]|nr:hypothetical protein [Armatimonadota bacterium]
MLATLLLGGLILGPAKGVVVVDMLAIGRLENGRWYTAKAEPNDPVGKTGAAKYYPLSMSGIGAPISLPKLRFDEEVAPGWYIEYVEKAASTALWTGTPAKAAKVVKYSPTSKTYVDVVKAHLQAKGLKNSKPRINAVYGGCDQGDRASRRKERLSLGCRPIARIGRSRWRWCSGDRYQFQLL